MTQSLVYLVTGCSAGIGEALAAEIAQRGHRVIATARNKSKLLSIECENVSILELDITWEPAKLRDIIQTALSIYGHIDILINNAGSAVCGMMEELMPEALAQQFSTNFFGPINLTNALLPHFRSRRTGTVVFIGSISSRVTDPGSGPYSTSKAALAMASQTYNVELRQFGIRTILIEPGYFRTSLLSGTPIIQDEKLVHKFEDYAPMNTELASDFAQVDGKQPGDPEKAAKRILDVIGGSGLAKGKPLPTRVLLGPDAVDIVSAECQDMLNNITEWSELSKSTNLDTV